MQKQFTQEEIDKIKTWLKELPAELVPSWQQAELIRGWGEDYKDSIVELLSEK